MKPTQLNQEISVPDIQAKFVCTFTRIIAVAHRS